MSKKLKRAYFSRIEAADALKAELSRKFPKTEFTIRRFETDYMSREEKLDLEKEYELKPTKLNQSLAVHWSNGAALNDVEKVTAKYKKANYIRN